MPDSPESLFKVLKKRQRLRSIGVLVSFPKSGRTWLRVMLDDLDIPFDYEHDGPHDNKSRPFDELTLCGKKKYLDKPVVFLSRDPRDTAVSGYFQKSLRPDGYAGTMADFIRDPLHGVEKIVRYNLTWLARGADLPAFLPITYEETVANPFAVVRGIVSFVGVEVSDAAIEHAVANNTFEKMRQREGRGEHLGRYGRYGSMLSPTNSSNPEAYKIRRGRVGGYIDYLSAEDTACCDEILERYRYFDKWRELTLTRPAQIGGGLGSLS